MITLELLTEYTHDILKYKENIKPFDFKDYGNFVHIFFDSMGESVLKKNYYEWLSKRRGSQIDKIIN